jgi:hypothetical protein
MTDYYPVIVRAVSGLPDNTAEARNDLYENARKIVSAQLRELIPSQSSGLIARERAALEAAIRGVEAEQRPARPRSANGSAPPTSHQHAVAVTRNGQGKAIAKSLSKIAEELQQFEVAEKTTRKSADYGAVTAQRSELPEEFGDMFRSLSSLLLGSAFIAAMASLIALILIRCLLLVAAGIIGYVTLTFAMMAAIGLLVAMPIMLFRRISIDSLLGAFLRRVYPVISRASLALTATLRSQGL